MMPAENWIDEQEKNSMFRVRDVRQQAERMLQISPTNRVVGVELSQFAVAVRQLNLKMGEGWDWLSRMVDMVEEYQLTVGEPYNSRLAFVEAMKTEIVVQSENMKKSKLTGV